MKPQLIIMYYLHNKDLLKKVTIYVIYFFSLNIRIYYDSKEVGGVRKMAFFADLQYYSCWRSGSKKGQNIRWRNTWMVPNIWRCVTSWPFYFWLNLLYCEKEFDVYFRFDCKQTAGGRRFSVCKSYCKKGDAKWEIN